MEEIKTIKVACENRKLQTEFVVEQAPPTVVIPKIFRRELIKSLMVELIKKKDKMEK